MNISKHALGSATAAMTIVMFPMLLFSSVCIYSQDVRLMRRSPDSPLTTHFVINREDYATRLFCPSLLPPSRSVHYDLEEKRLSDDFPAMNEYRERVERVVRSGGALPLPTIKASRIERDLK